MQYIKTIIHKDYSRCITCFNPRQQVYHLLIDKGEHSLQNDEVEAVFAVLHCKPTLEQIKKIINDYVDQQTDKRILQECTFKEHPVFLSIENQINKAAYDLAVQFNAEEGTIPVTFKLGTIESPAFVEFKTLQELADFYLHIVKHVRSCLEEGWKRKSNIDLSCYEQDLQVLQQV